MSNTEHPQTVHVPHEEDEVRIYSGVRSEEIQQDEDLLEILDLSAEQLTYYLEDAIVANPFIELEYSDISNVRAIEQLVDQVADEEEQQHAQSLEQYLFEQIMLYRETPIRDAMVSMVALLDERGFLTYTVDELARELDIPPVIALDAATLVKQLEPAGVGAYDTRESMMLQTERDDFAPNVAYYLLESFYQELNQQDYTEIIQQTGLTLDEIMACVNYYHMLRTSPASLFNRTSRIKVIPDVTIRATSEGAVSLTYNRQFYPKVRFNQDYYNDMKSRPDQTLQEYIRPQEEHYHRIATNLRRREELILTIVKAVVALQRDFFTGVTDQRLPLSIAKISEKTRLAAPIVYSVITNKNIEFNHRMYALSDFINMSATKGRTGVSASTVKQRILSIIANTNDLISNEEIVDILAKEDIAISPMIVASYRQAAKK